MPWWEISVVCVIWLTVRSWRRSKRSGPDVPNSPRYSPSSLLTVPKPNLLADLHPSKIQHDGVCQNCGVQAAVPLQRTRLERRPWRIVWWCAVCGRQSNARCPDELVPMFVRWDEAGGTSLSMREVADMVDADLDEFNRAIADEL
jgi:hypothetical protein